MRTGRVSGWRAGLGRSGRERGGAERPAGRAQGRGKASWLAPALLSTALLLALAAQRGGGWHPAVSSAASCAPLAGAEPVAVTVRATDGGENRGTGYQTREGEVLAPLRGLVERAAKLYWDDAGRTVTLLGPRDVVSVHFRGDRVETSFAVLNGEVIAAHAVWCAGQVYLPAELVAGVLRLDTAWPSARSLELAPR
ncbi:MAG: hypothetical protein DIU55_006880 [Bacillota bacterium]